MSLKQEIENWVSALARYDSNEFDDALSEFAKIADTSKILFNMGVIHATLGEHEKAIVLYQKSVSLDHYLAIAYFQQGVSNFLLGDFEEALANFNDTLLYLRGNTVIDYTQLGLLFKLYSCEALFNRGLCYIHLQNRNMGMQDLNYAAKEKIIEDHDVIDEAIREEAEGYTVFSIPVGVVFRPNEAKVRNLKAKDYLGKARLVAASDAANVFTGFSGLEIKNAVNIQLRDDRPNEAISFAASNLVNPAIHSRRQQSEPPAGRTIMPPTPPPEFEAKSSRGQPGRGKGQVPARLNLEKTRPSKPDSPSSPNRLPFRRAGAVPNDTTPRREPPRRRRSNNDDDSFSTQEVYDLYGNPSLRCGSAGQGNAKGHPPRPIEEEAEDGSDDSFDECDFEMMSPPRQAASAPHRAQSRRHREISKVRIKVHAREDVRYIMVGINIDFKDLVDRIREKFGIGLRFRLQVRDDDEDSVGDMVTLADQDDFDTVLELTKSEARKHRNDIGRAEMWVLES